MKKIIFILCLVVVATTIGTASHKPPDTDVRPVSIVTEVDGGEIPSTAKIDFEPQNPRATKEISDLTDSRRGNTTLEQIAPQNTDNITAVTAEKEEVEVSPIGDPVLIQNADKGSVKEPKMGDTRVVNGQKQVYFLGFGWLEDYGGGSHGIIAEDMYENGNKIGIMGGGTVGHSDGDINKMVGIMD